MSVDFSLLTGKKNVIVDSVEYDPETMVSEAVIKAVEHSYGRFVLRGTNGEFALIRLASNDLIPNVRRETQSITDPDEIQEVMDDVQKQMAYK
jgi:hypothetical protein